MNKGILDLEAPALVLVPAQGLSPMRPLPPTPIPSTHIHTRTRTNPNPSPVLPILILVARDPAPGPDRDRDRGRDLFLGHPRALRRLMVAMIGVRVREFRIRDPRCPA